MSTATLNVVTTDDTDLTQLYSEFTKFDPPVAAGTSTSFTLTDSGDGLQFVFSGNSLTYDAATHEVKAGTVTGIHLQTGAGADIATFAFSAGFAALNLMNAIHLMANSADKSGLDTIFGAYGYTFNGNAGADQFTGYANADTMLGGDGDDVLDGGGGNDTLSYASASAAVVADLSNTAQQDTKGAGKDTISNFENLVGSSHDDALFGTSDANVISGGDGNDLISGGVGADTLDGGNGNDTVGYFAGGAVTVTLGVNGAQTTVHGGDAEGDKIANFEAVQGGAGNDLITGNNLANTLSGNNADDTIQGGAGADTLDGGSGNDTVSYAASAAAVTVDLSQQGQDKVGGLADLSLPGLPQHGGDAEGDLLWNFESVLGTAKNDILTGSDGDDSLDGGAGNDTISGGAGNDVVTGGVGTDSLDGGADNDTLNYAASAAAVTITLNSTGAGSAKGGDAQGDTIDNFESVTGSAFNDTLTGDAGPNTIVAHAGNDIVDGGAGADLLDGGAGNDTVTYAASTAGVIVNLRNQGSSSVGPDADFNLPGLAQFGGDAEGDLLWGFENITGSSFDDTLIGDFNPNILKGGDGNDIIYGINGGADTLDGGVGNHDQISFLGAVVGGVTISLGTGGAQTIGHGGDAEGEKIANFEDIQGSSDADVLTGNELKNVIMGGLGDDVITGGGGADTLDGGGSDNTVSYALSPSAVTVSLNGSTPVFEHGGDAEGDKVSDFANIVGSAHDDILTGDATANIIAGGAGADTLDGGANNDTLNYAASKAAVTVTLNGSGFGSAGGGDAQGDTIKNFENVTGSAFNDVLAGDAGPNIIAGGAGNDTVDLSAGGDDTADGGAGNDTVSFATAAAGITWTLGSKTEEDFTGIGTIKTFNFEHLIATAFDDTVLSVAFASIDAGGGDDTILGAFLNGGRINGQAGDDFIQAGPGNDVLDGGTGGETTGDTVSYQYLGSNTHLTVTLGAFDSKTGNVAATMTSGVAGDIDKISNFESVAAGPGNDTLTGNAGANFLAGLAGDDVLQGGVGADSLVGGLGIDTASYAASSAGVTVKLNVGVQQGGDAQGDTISSSENLLGSAHDDILTGDTGNNTIDGGAGNDVIAGGDGDDVLKGNTGTGDTASYASATASVTVGLAVAFQQDTGGAGKDTLTGFENLTGSSHDDKLTGDGNANTIDGGVNGNDSLDGGAGSDTVSFASAVVGISAEGFTSSSVTFTLGSRVVSTTNFERVVGSAFDDDLFNSPGLAFVAGGDGDDFIEGHHVGVDTLDGGSGQDDYVSYIGAPDVGIAAGAVITLGKAGAVTTVTGPAGSDWAGDKISNFENVDGTLLGDMITGNEFANTLSGEDGDDSIQGSAGADFLDGGTGTDTLSYGASAASVTISLDGSNLVTEHGGDAEGDSVRNFENVIGSVKDDILTGDSGSNTIDGGAGNDTIDGGGGDDVLKGNTGTDTLSYASALAAVTVSLAITVQQDTKGAGKDTLSGFESLRGSDFADTLSGDGKANIIDGGIGADKLDGGAGSDTVSYADSLAGVIVDLSKQGKDLANGSADFGQPGSAQNGGDAQGDLLWNFENIIGSVKTDFLFGNTGANVINGGDGNDLIEPGAGADTVDGGSGTLDTVTYQDSGIGVKVTLGKDGTLTGFSASGGDAAGDKINNVESMSGSELDDVLTGNNLINTISGLNGDDVIQGGGGADTLDGGNNNAHGDTVSYAASLLGVTVTLNGPTAVIESGGDADGDSVKNFENIVGSAKDDILTGDGNENSITGGAGNDLIIGGAGNDIIDGGAGDDVIEGGAGGAPLTTDKLIGGAGNDTVSYEHSANGVSVDLNVQDGTTAQSPSGGDSSFDVLSGFENVFGSASNDTLIGNSAANVVRGGGGTDLLTGGGGADKFQYQAASDGGFGEAITDFTTGDKISTLKSGFGGNLQNLQGAILDTHYFAANAGAVATEGGHGQFLFDTNVHELYWDDDGTGADAKVGIVSLANMVTLHATDFELR